MLEFQLFLLRRYAPKLHWTIFLATEALNHPRVVVFQKEYGVEILSLAEEEKGFLESREAGLRKLPKQYTYVLMLQEDFLLDREPMYETLAEACRILDMDRSVASLRLMPCPGPLDTDPLYHPDQNWKILTDEDPIVFTYQATLWRTYDIHFHYKGLLSSIEKDFPDAVTFAQKKHIALNMNCAETHYGQAKIREIPNLLHLAWSRKGNWSNAVYLSPFPYRPTAIVRGKIEPFASELAIREGFGQTLVLE